MPDANKYTEAILDTIMDLESSGGTNPAALKQNSAGALGNYGMTPGKYEDVQRIFKDKWKGKDFKTVALDPKLSREAARDGLRVGALNLASLGVAPTANAVILEYHTGVGNVAKGNIGPLGKKYINDARRLLEKRGYNVID